MPGRVLIKLRRDTAANWTATNPTLAAGEPGYETNTGNLKIGDGATAWNGLAYFATGGGGVTSLDAITGAVILTAGSGVTITDNSPSPGHITIAASGTASGAEIAYTPITASVNVVSTVEATGTTIISPGAQVFNGSPVMVELSCQVKMPNTSPGLIVLSLFEGVTQITELVEMVTTPLLQASVGGRYRFTPSAASHTYTVTAFVNSTTGTPAVLAGSGGVGTPPAFLRFTYA